MIGTQCTHLIIDEVATDRLHDNENDRLKPDWMTLAELLQWVRQSKRRLSRDLDRDPQLWRCPEHRRTWRMRLALEQLAHRQAEAEKKS